MLPVYVVAGALLLLLALSLRQVTVFEYERGLRYRNGRFAGVLGPGSYWFFPRFTRIARVDVRPTHIVVPGQEVITSDGVGLKITVAAKYAVTDPAKALHSNASYSTALYTVLQLTLRELVGGSPVDEVLSGRPQLNAKLHEKCAPAAVDLGLELYEADIKDIMFPGDLKKVFSQVVRARQEGLAALEKARGESAALRNLANAAALLEQRPGLLQLRILQAMGPDGGNTIVVGMNGTPDVVPLKTRSKPERSTAADEAP